jgi:hypothetical protein
MILHADRVSVAPGRRQDLLPSLVSLSHLGQSTLPSGVYIENRQLKWFGGDSYLLTNNSPLDAHGVQIKGDPSDIDLQVGKDLPWEVGAMSAEKFMFAARLGHGFARDVVVTWTRDGSPERLSGRHTIPLRPTT